MKGFSNRFRDFPDYILGITHEIWEDRGVDTLHDYYAPDIVVRSPASVVVGNTTVIDATHATLREFPDRELLGEDVIWSGTPEDGMLSSHRIMSTATHASDGAYGPASGTKLKYRVLADCHAINNQINDEWLIRDQGAIVRQLGLDPKAFAAAQLATEGDAPAPVLTPATDLPGPYSGRGNDNPFGARLADVLTRITDGETGVFEAEYDRAAQEEYAGGISGNGWGDADDWWGGLRAAFPSARFQIDHVIGREDQHMPPRAALRWSLTGRHDGPGLFGPATGAEVYVLGITHAEFGALVTDKLGLRREFTLVDETAIWKQILMATG
jgi:predicted ester cyclase